MCTCAFCYRFSSNHPCSCSLSITSDYNQGNTTIRKKRGDEMTERRKEIIIRDVNDSVVFHHDMKTKNLIDFLTNGYAFKIPYFNDTFDFNEVILEKLRLKSTTLPGMSVVVVCTSHPELNYINIAGASPLPPKLVLRRLPESSLVPSRNGNVTPTGASLYRVFATSTNSFGESKITIPPKQKNVLYRERQDNTIEGIVDWVYFKRAKADFVENILPNREEYLKKGFGAPRQKSVIRHESNKFKFTVKEFEHIQIPDSGDAFMVYISSLIMGILKSGKDGYLHGNFMRNLKLVEILSGGSDWVLIENANEHEGYRYPDVGVDLKDPYSRWATFYRLALALFPSMDSKTVDFSDIRPIPYKLFTSHASLFENSASYFRKRDIAHLIGYLDNILRPLLARLPFLEFVCWAEHHKTYLRMPINENQTIGLSIDLQVIHNREKRELEKEDVQQKHLIEAIQDRRKELLQKQQEKPETMRVEDEEEEKGEDEEFIPDPGQVQEEERQELLDVQEMEERVTRLKADQEGETGELDFSPFEDDK